MFESRHSDYLKEAEKSHFQGQYLEGAIFFVGFRFMPGLCRIHAGFMQNSCRVYVEFMLGLFRIYVGFLCIRNLTFSCSRILYVT